MTNLRNAHTILQKMQSLLDQMEMHPGLNTRLERDLMLSYSRRLYELFIDMEVSEQLPNIQIAEKNYSPINKENPEPQVAEQEMPYQAVEPPVAEEKIEESKPEWEEPAPIEPVEEPVIKESELVAVAENQIRMPFEPRKQDIFSFEPVDEIVEAIPVESTPVELNPVAPVSDDAIVSDIEVHIPEVESVIAPMETSVPPLHFYPESHADLYDLQESGLLVEKFNSIPIPDLFRAWGLNDKILTINSLFDGSVQAFESTLNSLNQVRNFDEAKQFLSQYVVDKYGWASTPKLEKAQQFLKTIRRRYL